MADGSTLDYLPGDEAHGATGLRRLAVGLMAYPLLAVASLYATWLAAWAALGHQPVPFIDDAPPGLLVGVPGTVLGLLLTFAVPVMGLHLGLILASLVERTRGAGWRFSARGAAVALAAVCTWGAALLLLWWDPLRAACWYFH